MRCHLRSARNTVFILFSFFLLEQTLHAQTASDKKHTREHKAQYAAKDPANAMPQQQTVISPVKSSIEVHAEELTSENISPAREAYREEIQSSAGTYGDYSRYLLMMPGVVTSGNADVMNDVLVRGGHPSENLYVVDGLEVPYVNHFTVEGTPSGFVPMINTSSISKVSLQPGAYDTQYSSRLSSLIEIQTRDQNESPNSGEINFGISGLGGFWNTQLSSHTSALLAMDRSLLNLATSDIGLGGVPTYTNGMARMVWSPSPKDQVSLLSLSGGDTITINPCAGSPREQFTIDTQYGGLRSTNGLVWLHTHGPTTVSKFTASYASQGLGIHQQNQMVNGTYVTGTGEYNCKLTPQQGTPVYSQDSLDRLVILGYNLRHDLHRWMLSAGGDGHIIGLDYSVSQPDGELSPYSPDPTRSDAVTFHQTPTSGQISQYVDLTGPFGQRWTAQAGYRMEIFTFPQAQVWEPHAGVGFRITHHQAIHAAYRRSAQLPAYMDMLSYPQNHSLLPLKVQQLSFGGDLWRTSMWTLSAEIYRKWYTDEPVSTEYPTLALANLVYNPGDQIVWLPLQSAGKGKAHGVEMLLRGHLSNRLNALVSLTYAHSQYAALDHIYRAGNYDIPLVGNALLTWRLPREWNLSLRDTYTAGRPYTPFDTQLSVAQDRGIYDLTKVNALRGPAYNRMDISFDHNFRLRRGVFNLYAGVQNVFDRKNFLGYVWLNRCNEDPGCMASFHGVPQVEIFQMPAFPIAGLRWDF